MSKMREEFEAWLAKDGYPKAAERRPDGEYRLLQSAIYWKAWQAGYRAGAEESDKLLREAVDECVSYMASGMTHAAWKTEKAQGLLARIDAHLGERAKENSNAV